MCLRHRVANVRIVLVWNGASFTNERSQLCVPATQDTSPMLVFEALYTLEPCPVVWLSFWAHSEMAEATMPGATQ